jgi:hypothetical protein
MCQKSPLCFGFIMGLVLEKYNTIVIMGLVLKKCIQGLLWNWY